MLCQRRRRWPNIEPAQGQSPVFAGQSQKCAGFFPALTEQTCHRCEEAAAGYQPLLEVSTFRTPTQQLCLFSPPRDFTVLHFRLICSHLTRAPPWCTLDGRVVVACAGLPLLLPRAGPARIGITYVPFSVSDSKTICACEFILPLNLSNNTGL